MPLVETLARLRALLSEAPERSWPDGVVHHGARVLLLLLLVVLVQFLFPVAPAPDSPQVERGQVRDTDIVATVDFEIPKTPAELARDREEAASSVPLVFRYDEAAADSMRAAVDGATSRAMDW